MTRSRVVSSSLMLAGAAGFLFTACGPAASDAGGGAKAGNGRAAMIARIDSLVNAPIKAGKVAGASVGVVKGSDTLVLKGYGMADLEHDVPTPEHATYEIGSVTKQFTGAAIMQLVEQGKLSLDDDFTKYLPGYPTQGNKITVRRLLDHTSGIKGYTEIPEFRVLQLRHLPKDSAVALFSKKPFDFKTGDQEIYNNSAFFLAGLIIEKLSGMSYGDYVQKNLFEKAGMKDSYYCSERTIHKKHAHGYDTDSTGLVLKGYLDHTWPYAAGSLCSSAADLVAWNQVLHKSSTLLKPESYQELITPGTLNDGTKLRYAKGLSLGNIAGHRAISHGGGINGFLSQSEYFPDDDLIVVVLFNTAGPVGPADVAEKIAEVVLGKAADESKPFAGNAADYTGSYAGPGRGRVMDVTIGADAGKLTIKMGEQDSVRALSYYEGDTFGRNESRFTFVRSNGKVTGLRADLVYGYSVLKKK